MAQPHRTLSTDRKSTRLNSSHLGISYAVFCHALPLCPTRRYSDLLPQFITEIDGLDVHFIHVRSKHANAMPLVVSHGWPGSIIEQLKIIDPLVNPTAHGAAASDAFH